MSVQCSCHTPFCSAPWLLFRLLETADRIAFLQSEAEMLQRRERELRDVAELRETCLGQWEWFVDHQLDQTRALEARLFRPLMMSHWQQGVQSKQQMFQRLRNAQKNAEREELHHLLQRRQEIVPLVPQKEAFLRQTRTRFMARAYPDCIPALRQVVTAYRATQAQQRVRFERERAQHLSRFSQEYSRYQHACFQDQSRQATMKQEITNPALFMIQLVCWLFYVFTGLGPFVNLRVLRADRTVVRQQSEALFRESLSSRYLEYLTLWWSLTGEIAIWQARLEASETQATRWAALETAFCQGMFDPAFPFFG